ncbi:MAG: tripartite tricarboxylate transporter TctB family protein [Firmicutes bacterium]|nr:tripartite tricarboxylate transporter TctB family protein [Bacillota bacterium]
MIFIRFFMPILFILVSICFLIGTFHLPKAKLGDPNGPLYFPAGVSIFLLITSFVYLIQEWRQQQKYPEFKRLLSGRTPILIVSTLVLGLLYALVFLTLGFLVSTTLFLAALLFVINGRSKWLLNLTVAVLFSMSAWVVFSQWLDISLP